MRYSNFTPEDEARFLKFTSRGMTAIFIYSNKLVHNGERRTYNPSDIFERVVTFSGVMYAPVSLFVDVLGAEYKKRCGKITLSLNGKSVSVKDDKKTGYLPAEQVCRALGFATGLFSENSFLVIGKAEDIKVLSEDEAMLNAAPYALFGDYDTSSFTDEDYEAAAKNFHDKLVGTKETNDPENPYVREKLDVIDANCEKALSTLDRSGDPPILWGEKLLRDTEDGARQYSYVRQLALGYATYGSKYYENKEVFDAIIYSLDWMYRHAYGDDMIEGHGWRDPKLPNWWYMYIGAPEHLTEILLMLYKEISLEERRRYLKCFEWIASWMCLGPAWRKTRIKICTEYGVLLHKPAYLVQEAEDFDAELRLPRPDYIDFTHTYPHNMSYGGIFLSRFQYISSVLAGTALEYNSPNLYKQFYRLKYMYEPAMYYGQGMFMLAGRYTKQMVEASRAAGTLVYAISMIGVFGEDEDEYIKRLLKKHARNEKFRKAVMRGASFQELATFEKILKDESIPTDYDYEYAHAWYSGDRAVQHRNGYAFGIAMASKRHINYESILHENKVGWYTGDGAFHLYTTYDTEQYDGENFINNFNIAYRFPGTTEDMQEREHRGICFNPWHSPNNFAGSMQFDDKYIAAGMDFISEFCDEDDGRYDEVMGQSRAVHKNDLKAKKAWFCFDDEAVLLGAGITSTMNSPVNTTAAHRRIVRDEELSQFVKCDGVLAELPKSEFEERYKNPDYVLWQGHAGFVPLMDTDLFVSRYNYTTNLEQSYLELRVEHGKNPTGAGYAFAVLPYADKEKLERYSKAPDVEIISNTDKIQAVKEKNLNLSGYVFYEAGECNGIKVDAGAIVMACDRGETMDVSVCDPTLEGEEITLAVSGVSELISSDPKAVVSSLGKAFEIKINVKDSMGRPYRFTFKK